MNLFQATEWLVRNRGDITLTEIAAKTQVKRDWLQSFALGRIGEPGVHKVQRIHDYLITRVRVSYTVRNETLTHDTDQA